MTGKKCAYNTIIIYKHEHEVYVNKRNVNLAVSTSYIIQVLI